MSFNSDIGYAHMRRVHEAMISIDKIPWRPTYSEMCDEDQGLENGNFSQKATRKFAWNSF